MDFPASGGSYSSTTWDAGCSSRICGTAADTVKVASVAVSVRQGSGNYWDGTGFNSTTEVLLAATGTTSWTLGFPASNFPADGAYAVRAVATDGVGRTASVTHDFTMDVTQPAPTALTLSNANGIVDPAIDEAMITFSEPLDVSSICSAWAGTGDQSLTGSGVVVTITDNGSNDILTVTSTACTLHIGWIETGGNYVDSTSTFSGLSPLDSRVTWTASTRVLTIHIGEITGGLPNLVAQPASTAVYTPDPAITDVAGNPTVTTPFSSGGQRF